jgi:hypothetical protein
MTSPCIDRLALVARRDYNLPRGEALMRNKPAAVDVDEDWEVMRDVIIHKPLGIVLAVRLEHPQLGQIGRAAESLGLNSLDFVRQAAFLVANDPSLWQRLARPETPEPPTGIPAREG